MQKNSSFLEHFILCRRNLFFSPQICFTGSSNLRDSNLFYALSLLKILKTKLIKCKESFGQKN